MGLQEVVLFVNSLFVTLKRFLLSFPLKNDNKGPFSAGFHKVLEQQQEIIIRLTKLFSNLTIILFRQFVVNGMVNLKYQMLLFIVR